MVRCSITGSAISTGIDTDSETLAKLPTVDVGVHCPLCGEKHFWTREFAFVTGEATARDKLTAPNILQ
jgi:hypothetical protein